jgi:hypothetical protein
MFHAGRLIPVPECLASMPSRGVDRRADYSNLFAAMNNFQRVSLQRRQLHHLIQIFTQQLKAQEVGVMAAEEELSWTIQVNAGGRRRGKRAMP